MIQYYHIDPTLLEIPANWPLLSDIFGFHHGRLIVAPTHQEALSHMKRRGLAGLKAPPPSFSDCFAKGTCRPDHYLWGEPKSGCISLAQRASNPQWSSSHAIDVPRHPDKVAHAIAPALLFERQVVFIDPYFDTTRSFIATLLAIVGILQHQDLRRTIIIHSKLKPKDPEREGTVLCERRATRIYKIVKPRLPPDWDLTVQCWQKRTPFHNRYVLGEAGGIGSCWGFDASNENENDTLFIMDNKLSASIRNRFRTQPYYSYGCPRRVR